MLSTKQINSYDICMFGGASTTSDSIDKWPDITGLIHSYKAPTQHQPIRYPS
jgi:hypothetical protein